VHHEILISELQPNTDYSYIIKYGNNSDEYSFHTAPSPGTRTKFTFAYASDSRANNGGGERNLMGVNAYILKKITALCAFKGVSFFQFTGDMINGYSVDPDDIVLQYANYKRTIEPFAHYFPIVSSIGNHEALVYLFADDNDYCEVDRFPFTDQSMEAVYALNFVNPANGPKSEDGAVYDPDPDKVNFPPYDETVFYYTYDNVAVISLNSNYWYSPNLEEYPESGGNLHAYIMDKQLEWFASVLERLEKDSDIDHIFVTLHTPFFPNGGHVGDDMWYNGNNLFRPTVAGKPVEYGIIERRDQLLDLMINKSSKVIAALTGDEHNYHVMRLTADTPIYPENYSDRRIDIARPIWFINNGAAGAPYYGQEKTPWSDHVRIFSTQNAIVFFHVNGKTISVEVINPDTLELIDGFDLL
jgi:hypothetical protein